MVALMLSIALLGMTATAMAAGAAVYSAPTPASGAVIAKKATWLSVRADDTAPIISATMLVNGSPMLVTMEYPGGYFAYNEEQESDVWVNDDPTLVRLMVYNCQNKLVVGLNTVAATVTSASGISTYSWTFSYGSASSVTVVSPAVGAVLPSSPAAITANLTSPNTSFTSTMTLDGTVVATAYSPGTKTFSHTPATALTPGTHTVVLAAKDTAGGTATRTWSFTVRPPMSSGNDCTSCHTTYPAMHPLSGCGSCHTRGYVVPGGSHGNAIPTVAGCAGSGDQQASACHRLDHTSDSQWGIWGSGPFTCAQCHSAAYPNVPRHTDASTTVVHASTSTGCEPCHGNSLVAEHGKYPSAATIKYQCDLCHGPTVRQQVKDAIAGNLTACSSCHTAADHNAAHAITVPPSCGAVGCHTGTTLTTLHATPGCDGCHSSASPVVIAAIAAGTRDCAACHVGDPHPATAHLAGGSCVVSGCHADNVSTLHASGPSCASCHDAGKTRSLVCTSCHTGALHVTANHTSTETCNSCHAITNIIAIHGDNCATCHATPAAGMTWTGKCSQAGCHPTSHTRFTTHQGDHGGGTDCGECHDGDANGNCSQCHSVYDRTAPVTTSNAVASYTGTATITLSRSDAGGSGIRSTYYQLDGLALNVGTVVLVAPPVSGSATHTLDFWSMDNGFNTETHKRVTLVVRAP